MPTRGKKTDEANNLQMLHGADIKHQ